MFYCCKTCFNFLWNAILNSYGVCAIYIYIFFFFSFFYIYIYIFFFFFFFLFFLWLDESHYFGKNYHFIDLRCTPWSLILLVGNHLTFHGVNYFYYVQSIRNEFSCSIKLVRYKFYWEDTYSLKIHTVSNLLRHMSKFD